MKGGQFAISSITGNHGVGYNEFVPWHKRAKENILKALGIEVTYHEAKKRKKAESISEEEETEETTPQVAN